MSNKSKEAAKEAKQEEAKEATKGAAKEASTEEEKPEGAEDVAPAKAGPPMLLMIGAIVIAVLAGGALGGFVVGPKFTPSTHAVAADAHGDEGGEEGAEGEEGGHGDGAHGSGDAHGKGGRQYTYQIENIIVNPAGSGGSRFLMATIAFELSDEKPANQLRDRDVQVRDVVISVLERKTLIDLTEPGSREVIKKELHDAVKPLAGAATWMRVYLPQFVLQ